MAHTTSSIAPLRLRVFAGPNGSGKSTVIKSISQSVIGGKRLYLGDYINADDIASELRKEGFSFSAHKTRFERPDIINFATRSGLLSNEFQATHLEKSFAIKQDRIIILEEHYTEHLAQIIARLLRERFIAENRRFSFETVFSHRSNLDIMHRAKENGYKVYLYFVSTADPEINKYRVALRVQKNGHNVPSDKIESRYYRSLELVREAADIAYQAFFFDNSVDGAPFKLVGHFKTVDNEKRWDEIDEATQPLWFKKYCIQT